MRQNDFFIQISILRFLLHFLDFWFSESLIIYYQKNKLLLSLIIIIYPVINGLFKITAVKIKLLNICNGIQGNGKSVNGNHLRDPSFKICKCTGCENTNPLGIPKLPKS